jgi:hypothetical protein
MTDPLEHTLARIAALAPTPLATERARAAVENALRTSRRRRWLLPLSLAAALLLLASLFFPLLSPAPLSAAERLGQALDTTHAYKGWLRITTRVDAISRETYLDTQTHTQVAIHHSFNNRDTIEYKNPATGEWAQYAAATNTLRLSTFADSENDEFDLQQAAATILSYDDLLTRLKMLHIDLAGITARPEAGLDRYDIGPLVAAATQAQHAGNTNFPVSFWVDRRTGRIAEMTGEEGSLSITYDCAPITSIYDAGALRSAKIIDLRPPKDALAAVARIRRRQVAPLPDGLSFFYTETRSTTPPKKTATLRIYSSTGDRWFQRYYTVRTPDQPDPAHLDLPANWNTTATDELLRRAANTPASQITGDAHLVVRRDADGHASYTYFNPVAQEDLRLFRPTRELYPLTTSFSFGCTLDLRTAPDRPGQLDLHFQVIDGSFTTNPYWPGGPDQTNLEVTHRTDDYWIDPAHADRFLTHIQTALPFRAKDASKLAYKAVTEFSNYQSLPAPDTRAYPTTWTTTLYTPDKDGALSPTQHQTTTFLFLPHHSLPTTP